MIYKKGVIFMLAAFLLVATACVQRTRVGALRTESETVERGGAESVRGSINMGAGRLTMNAGAAALLEAEFTYNVEGWRPEVNYSVVGSEGQLSVSQPETSSLPGISDGNIRYDWDLRLNDDVPIDLTINLGAGESQLNLRGLNLTGLRANVGVGSTTIDLGGDWDQSFDVAVRGGVGETRVLLPREVGVRVETRTGLGDVSVSGLTQEGDAYVNSAYGQSEVVLNVLVEGGIGAIRLEPGE